MQILSPETILLEKCESLCFFFKNKKKYFKKLSAEIFTQIAMLIFITASFYTISRKKGHSKKPKNVRQRFSEGQHAGQMVFRWFYLWTTCQSLIWKITINFSFIDVPCWPRNTQLSPWSPEERLTIPQRSLLVSVISTGPLDISAISVNLQVISLCHKMSAQQTFNECHGCSKISTNKNWQKLHVWSHNDLPNVFTETTF